AVDFGAVSTEKPSGGSTDSKGNEVRQVKLEVDYVVQYHWGRIDMWEPHLVKQNPNDNSKWKRIGVAEANRYDYSTDPNATTIKLHYRLDPAPNQDDPPADTPDDLKKLASHFSTAQTLFKAIYDNAVEQVSDSNTFLGPNPPTPDKKTELDDNVSHQTLHPDYSRPNHDG